MYLVEGAVWHWHGSLVTVHRLGNTYCTELNMVVKTVDVVLSHHEAPGER